MSVEEVRAAAAALAKKITDEVRTLENQTGCKLHALAVDQHPPANGESQTVVRVRMEI